jgi:glutaredoxin 3
VAFATWLKSTSILWVSYTDIDVEKDPKAAKEALEKSGQMGVPVIDIDGQIVVGFDKPKIDTLILNKK